MTQTTKDIFEKHEVRKTKEQKKRFREYLSSIAKERGFNVTTEKATGGATNVIVGDPESARVIFSAHYDTCAVMPIPNFITPKCIPIYVIYQLFLTTAIYIIPFLLMFSSANVLEATDSGVLYFLTLFGGYALLILFSYLMMAGPANKHTANDNTSGVTLLIDIMQELPEELMDRVAFIFFDLEEMGTFGSAGYKKLHPKVAKEKLLLNFDCVSDGENILFVAKKGAHSVTEKLKEAFRPEGKHDGKFSVDVATKGAFYPSDQAHFVKGVGVAALKKSKHGILYMNRIHTKRDIIYCEENIEFLKDGAIKLVKILSE